MVLHQVLLHLLVVLHVDLAAVLPAGEPRVFLLLKNWRIVVVRRGAGPLFEVLRGGLVSHELAVVGHELLLFLGGRGGLEELLLAVVEGLDGALRFGEFLVTGAGPQVLFRF